MNYVMAWQEEAETRDVIHRYPNFWSSWERESEREELPGNVDEGVEDAGESESDAEKGAKGEERGIL